MFPKPTKTFKSQGYIFVQSLIERTDRRMDNRIPHYVRQNALKMSNKNSICKNNLPSFFAGFLGGVLDIYMYMYM